MNHATFVSYSESQNTSKIPTNQRFTVTWRVRNMSNAAWGTGFQFVHIHAGTGSSLLTKKAAFDLAEVASRPTVAPGSEVSIKVEMTAPSRANHSFFTDWQLRDPQGNLFGDVLWLRLNTIAAFDRAKFVSYRESHDTDQMPTNQAFTATWRIRNSGNTTWGETYKVTFKPASSVTRLATKASFTLAEIGSEKQVLPGQEVDINLPLVAPSTPDHRYRTVWQMQTHKGKRFGDTLWLWLVTKKSDTPSPNLRKSNLKLIGSHTIPDGTPINTGKTFVKQWVVRNTGERSWNEGYRLVFISGDSGMSGSFSHSVPPARPGEEVVISVNMIAPSPRTTAYTSTWRVHDTRNTPFGASLSAKIFSIAQLNGYHVTPYSQNDPAWKHRVLGQGSRTFGEFGCLVTCFAMMLSRYGEDESPLQLNNKLLSQSQGRGFNGSDVFFVSPAFAYGHLTYWGNFKPFPHTGATWATHEPNFLNKIDVALNLGHSVIVQVDIDPSDPYHLGTEQHWVLVLARQGNDYLVMDPFVGQAVSLLGRYGQQQRASGERALLQAIKSALFYRSTKQIGDGEDDDGGEGDENGRSTMRNPNEELEYTGPDWQFNRCLIGVHDRANRHPQPADFTIAKGRFESVKVTSGVTVPEMNGYSAQFYLCRLFESWNGRHVPVEAFVRAVVPDMERLVDAGVRYFEFHNEPNLTHEGLKAHGVNGSWRNGAEFAQYFIEGRKKLRQRFPNIKVGFPGLSPGASQSYTFGHDSGFRLDDMEFLEGAEAAVRAADFLCVHAYYVNMKEVRGSAIELIKKYRRRFPNKLMFVSEFSNPDPARNIPAAEKGKQAKEFYRLCKQIPGMGGAYYFIVSGSGWDHQALRRDGDGRSTGIIEAML